MEARHRAGDQRRSLEAVLYYGDNEIEALGQVLHEAHEVGRGHDFVFALVENLVAALDLETHPERRDDIRRRIAELREKEERR